MNNYFTIVVFGLEAAFFLTCAIILVFLIINRIKTKKEENFEKRDN